MIKDEDLYIADPNPSDTEEPKNQGQKRKLKTEEDSDYMPDASSEEGDSDYTPSAPAAKKKSSPTPKKLPENSSTVEIYAQLRKQIGISKMEQSKLKTTTNRLAERLLNAENEIKQLKNIHNQNWGTFEDRMIRLEQAMMTRTHFQVTVNLDKDILASSVNTSASSNVKVEHIIPSPKPLPEHGLNNSENGTNGLEHNHAASPLYAGSQGEVDLDQETSFSVFKASP